MVCIPLRFAWLNVLITHLRLGRSLGHCGQKMVLGPLIPVQSRKGFSFFASSSCGSQDSTNFIQNISFSPITAIPPPLLADSSWRGELRTPSQHRLVMRGQGKGRSHMEVPPPGLVRNSGPQFDQTRIDIVFFTLASLRKTSLNNRWRRLEQYLRGGRPLHFTTDLLE
jgi:hypothetical protein